MGCEGRKNSTKAGVGSTRHTRKSCLRLRWRHGRKPTTTTALRSISSFRAKRAGVRQGIKDTVGFRVVLAVEVAGQVITTSGPCCKAAAGHRHVVPFWRVTLYVNCDIGEEIGRIGKSSIEIRTVPSRRLKLRTEAACTMPSQVALPVVPVASGLLLAALPPA